MSASEERTLGDPALEAALRMLDDVPPRDPMAAARGRAIFLAQAQAVCANRAREARSPSDRASSDRAPSDRAPFDALSNLPLLTPVGERKRVQPGRKIWRLAAAAIGACVLGSATAVYAAQASYPPDVLYPVKLWSEEARLALAHDEHERLDLLIQFSQHRLDELRSASPHDAWPQAVVQRLDGQMHRATEIAAMLVDLDADTAATLAQLRLQADGARRRVQPSNSPPDSPELPSVLPVVAAPASPTPAPATPASPTAVALEPGATEEPTRPIPPPSDATPAPTGEPQPSATPMPIAPATPIAGTPPMRPPPMRTRRPPPPAPLPAIRQTVESIRETAVASPETPPGAPPGAPPDASPEPPPIARPLPGLHEAVRETAESIRATARAAAPHPDDVRATMQAIRETAMPPAPPEPPNLAPPVPPEHRPRPRP